MSNPYNVNKPQGGLRKMESSDIPITSHGSDPNKEDVEGAVSFSPPPRNEASNTKPIASAEVQRGMSALLEYTAKEVAKEREAAADTPVNEEQEEPPTEKETEEAVESMLHPTWEQLRRDYIYSNTKIDNYATRSAIEKRSQGIDLDNLLYSDRIEQAVSIIPSKLEAVFQSITREDYEWVAAESYRRYPILESDTPDNQANTTLRNNFTDSALLAISVVSLTRYNIKSVLSTKTKKSHINTQFFNHNLSVISGMNEFVFGVLTVNRRWFQDRCRVALTDAAIGDMLIKNT